MIEQMSLEMSGPRIAPQALSTCLGPAPYLAGQARRIAGLKARIGARDLADPDLVRGGMNFLHDAREMSRAALALGRPGASDEEIDWARDLVDSWLSWVRWAEDQGADYWGI